MATPTAIIGLKEVHMSDLLRTWPATQCVGRLRSPPRPTIPHAPPALFPHRAARAYSRTSHTAARALGRSVSEFAGEIGGSIGAALCAGKADLNSCKLSHCLIAAGVDLSSSAHGRGAHGDEKLTAADGAVFLSTPGEWQDALRARLGAPHHCKDVAAALTRSGILIHDGALSLLHSGAKHELEGFKGDAWLFELPRCVAAAAAAASPLPPNHVPFPRALRAPAAPTPTAPTTPHVASGAKARRSSPAAAARRSAAWPRMATAAAEKARPPPSRGAAAVCVAARNEKK